MRSIVRERKFQYLRPLVIYQKTKDTLLSQTLKVEEKKVSFVFLFVAQEPRYGHLNIGYFHKNAKNTLILQDQDQDKKFLN